MRTNSFIAHKKTRLSAVFMLAVTLLMILLSPDKTIAKSFRKRSISSSARNETETIKASKPSGRKTGSSFTNAMADASVRLLQETISAESSGTNILISPDSILTAVSIAGCGASGQTLSELKNALGSISPKKYAKYLYTLHKRVTKAGNLKYTTANSLWYRKGRIKLKKSYLKRVAGYFKAEVYAAPFNSRTVKDINHWVYNKTRGKIPSIIRRLTSDMRLVIVNAVYFKGKWEEPYSSTVKRTFTKEGGSKKTVSMLEGTERTYLNVNGADGFVKAYKGGRVAFLALLPPAGTSVREYVSSLTGSALISGYKNRKKTGITVYTRMPEFKYDYSASLETPLKNMGISSLFSRNANLSGMTKSRIYVDDVLHKTYINVNKNGTEAAAATAIIMKAGSVITQTQVKEVYLDRPFVYALIDVKTGVPLFIGVVKDPG